MIDKSKFAFMAAVALLSIASPALAWTARTAPHRHVYHFAPNRPVYNYAPDLGVASPSNGVDNPVDNPATTGGGSMGYNACAGHPSC